jgi:hypothetical protein
VPAVVRRSAAFVLVVVLAAAGGAGCGESDKDKYIDDYKPLNEDLLNVSEKLSKAVQSADSQNDAQLADTFEGLADDLQKVGDDIADLDTPDDLKNESATLTRRIDAAVDDINDIAKAAADHDAQAAAAATVALGAAGLAVNRAQNALAKATGADVGER